MEFFEVIKARRSIRKYTDRPVPSEVIERALDAALLAPNSSNLQTWEFHWVQTPSKKAKLVEACMSQSAARGAQELIVIVANPWLWKRTNPKMLEYARAIKAPKLVQTYYEKLVPMSYGWSMLGPLKWLFFNAVGLFKPIVRGPVSFRGIQEVSIKSAALAAENFLLAVVAQGFACCPMEGLDEWRVKKLLGLSRGSRVVMAVSVGEELPGRGTWGPQIRFERDWFVKKV